MKILSIRGKKFDGEIQLHFLREELIQIDFSRTNLTDEQKIKFLGIVAVGFCDADAMMEKMPGCVLVDDDYEVTIDQFKTAYPYARNSHLLPPIWNKMTAAEKVLAWTRAGDYAQYCRRNEWYRPKIAAKWLKDKEWLNDWNKM